MDGEPLATAANRILSEVRVPSRILGKGEGTCAKCNRCGRMLQALAPAGETLDFEVKELLAKWWRPQLENHQVWSFLMNFSLQGGEQVAALNIRMWDSTPTSRCT